MFGPDKTLRITVLSCLALISSTVLFAQLTGSQSQTGKSPFLVSPTKEQWVSGSGEPRSPFTNSPISPPAACLCVGEVESESVKKIERALRSPLNQSGFNFTEVTLRDVFKILRDEYQIPIHLDQVALEENGLSAEETVTVQVQGVSLRSALNLLLSDLQLKYIIKNEVLMITTPQKAAEDVKTCVYNVSDLVDPRAQQEDITSLIDVIKMSAGPEFFSGGKEGDLKSLKPGLLVIKESADVHAKIGDLLTAIRRMRGAQATVQDPRPAP